MSDGITRRREQRERVLGLLYESAQKNVNINEILSEQPVMPDEFVVELTTGVAAVTGELDVMIEKFLKGWTLERMPILDHLVLRIGIYELTSKPELSVAVIISEAVELAKSYSTEESGKYVNGVLSAVADEVRPAA